MNKAFFLITLLPFLTSCTYFLKPQPNDTAPLNSVPDQMVGDFTLKEYDGLSEGILVISARKDKIITYEGQRFSSLKADLKDEKYSLKSQKIGNRSEIIIENKLYVNVNPGKKTDSVMGEIIKTNEFKINQNLIIKSISKTLWAVNILNVAKSKWFVFLVNSRGKMFDVYGLNEKMLPEKLDHQNGITNAKMTLYFEKKDLYLEKRFTLEKIDSALVSKLNLSDFKNTALPNSTISTVQDFLSEVKIGNQIWMAENLNVDHFRNGDPIPEAKTNEDWITFGLAEQPAWCYYNNDPANGAKYGKLYNWYAVNDPRGLAPEGWQVPDKDAQKELFSFLGNDTLVGIKIKSRAGWDVERDKNGTNSSGFSALPGGNRIKDGSFWEKKYCCWWLANSYDDNDALDFGFSPRQNFKVFASLYYCEKCRGNYIRCIKKNQGNRLSNLSQENASQDKNGKNIFRDSWPEVKIGNQTWMTENLNADHFRNGDIIPEAKTDEEWKRADDNKQPAWCYYNNDPANASRYGKLYNWYALKDARGLAPAGYHIPSDAEWTQLTDYLGVKEVAGNKMKSIKGWNSNGNGTNSSGFSGLPGGSRDYSGTFSNIGGYGYWWSSTEDDTYVAWFRTLGYSPGYVYRYNDFKRLGFSVRCLRD